MTRQQQIQRNKENTENALAVGTTTAAKEEILAIQQPSNQIAQQEIIEEEEFDGPLKLDALMAKGIMKKDLQLLQDAGFYTVDAVAYAHSKDILAVKGISDQKCEKLKTAAKELVGMGFLSAATLHEYRENIVKVTTGSVQLDKLLRGGVETGSITELFGEFRTGKSQLCHTLAVTCQLPTEMSGGGGKCLWIDTESTFRPDRITQIAERFNIDPKTCLDNIAYAKAHNVEHQLELVKQAGGLMAQSRYSLIIVDSATYLYRSDFQGRAELASRQQHLMLFLRCIQKIADVYGVAVVITNQVMAKVDGMAMYGGNDKTPVGGHIIAHASQTRLYLRKGRGESRICKIYDSPNLPEGDATFSITNGGIQDYVDPTAGR